MSETLPRSFVTALANHLQESYDNELEQILREPDSTAHYDLELDITALIGAEPRIGFVFITSPTAALPHAADALREAQLALLDVLRGDGRSLSAKTNVHARPHRLPLDPSVWKSNISSLRSADVGGLLSLSATVTRVGAVLMREVEREFRCNKCKHEFSVTAPITQRGGAFVMPARCPSEWEKPCTSSQFVQKGDVGLCRDYQEIKVQEKVKSLEVGSIPRSILVVLQDSLVDRCKPGDDAVLTGILHRRWNRGPVVDMRCDMELMIEAVHVELTNERKCFQDVTDQDERVFKAFWSKHTESPLLARDTILRSFCPQIFGLYMVKLIIAMSLIGGCSRRDGHGTRVRGESHLLIVGDPGTAKSQILRYSAKLVPRVVLTTGIGTTSAGLTVTAAKDSSSGEWMLDAGALVLADGGLCCIDEFDGIREHDRGAIHEAMEQQTISVAKAGLVCTLDTRATVFAAMNPKAGKLSSEAGRGSRADGSLPVHLAVASPLLSRFDVVLTLLDQQDEKWDRTLSSFILETRGSPRQQPRDTDWSIQTLRTYVFYVKARLQPNLSEGAETVLSQYYTIERSTAARNAARTTVRLLESLIRLTQAHARLMFRSLAVVQDAVYAIAAIESSSASPQSVGAGASSLQATFPEDPEQEYRHFAKYVLVKLGLEGDVDIWEGYGDEPDTPRRPSSPSSELRECRPDPRSTEPSLNKENAEPIRPVSIARKPESDDDSLELPGSP